mmetsp:Transcript_1878/g.5222  ORF Transcript_1878/g.5222 Transcript_1878/m.5222 type:complete len:235 (+) Transcript_1878:1087-1791(+)
MSSSSMSSSSAGAPNVTLTVTMYRAPPAPRSKVTLELTAIPCSSSGSATWLSIILRTPRVRIMSFSVVSSATMRLTRAKKLLSPLAPAAAYSSGVDGVTVISSSESHLSSGLPPMQSVALTVASDASPPPLYFCFTAEGARASAAAPAAIFSFALEANWAPLMNFPARITRRADARNLASAIPGFVNRDLRGWKSSGFHLPIHWRVHSTESLGRSSNICSIKLWTIALTCLLSR